MKPDDREAVIEVLRSEADVELRGEFDYGEYPLDPEQDRIYWAVFAAVCKTDSVGPMGFKSLEAAALLEDGWNPGDPVERLNPSGHA